MKNRSLPVRGVDVAPSDLIVQLSGRLGDSSKAIYEARTPDDVVAVLERLIVTIPTSPKDKVGRWKGMMSLYRATCAAAAGGVSAGDIKPLARLVLDEARNALHRRHRIKQSH